MSLPICCVNGTSCIGYCLACELAVFAGYYAFTFVFSLGAIGNTVTYPSSLK